MPSIASPPSFNTQFDAKPGTPVPVGLGIVRLTAPNASVYTFTGTNSYLVGEDEIFVIDPGPSDNSHLSALLRVIGGKKVVAVLVTHTHRDHSALARILADECRAPLWFGGRHRLSRPKRLLEVNKLQKACDWDLVPDRVLADGDIIKAGTTEIEVVGTPGHCANHLCFGVAGAPYLFSGDHVMGWNSTLVATPDGSMRKYLGSLDRLIEARWTHYLPGHGDAIPAYRDGTNGRDFARALKMHRLLRNQQILDAVAAGASSVGEVVDRLYPRVGIKIRIAARMTVMAHVELLEKEGDLIIRRSLLGGMRLSLTKRK